MSSKCLTQGDRIKNWFLILVLTGMGLVWQGHNVWGEVLTETRLQEIRAHVQSALRKAKVLGDEGNYVEAFRLVFDVAYTERDTRLRLASETGNADQFPLMADAELTKLEDQLIHYEPSPLMQYFRNPDVPIQERLTAMAELDMLVDTQFREGEETRVQGKYGDSALMQVMTSPKLRPSEKREVLWKLARTVKAKYISTAQRESIREEIARLREEADQQFQAHQYVEAFILLTEAEQKARDIRLDLISSEDSDNLLQQSVVMFKKFAHADESPLMQVFKDRQIPTREKQYFLYALQKMVADGSLPETIVFRGKAYNGTLVQILMHPKIHWSIKDSILGNIEVEILKQELDYKPEYLLGIEEYFKQKRKEAEERQKARTSQ